MQAPSNQPRADVCLILEGTYPYVSGGVSTWTHDLLRAQSELRFHLVALLPSQADLTLRYSVPDNVIGLTPITVQHLPAGARRVKTAEALVQRLREPLSRIMSRGGLAELAKLMELLRPFRSELGSNSLLNSSEAWQLLLAMYGSQKESSFLDYFWTWRALLGGLYSMLLSELPSASVYHAVSTGYAGLYAARASLETGRPALLTEHGIYTNERRIEIAMADWLYERRSQGLAIDKPHRDLKDLWIDTFISYSRACYQACSTIITLYKDNQQLQLADGAPAEKLRVIPNGIDWERYSQLEPDGEPHPPTVALIGRVVPIKDVKTFIRACAILRGIVPNAEILILGPTDEDADYFRECRSLAEHSGLNGALTFTGPVRIDEYLGKIDVIALTSISEAQPLVILEAGAAGIPCVATDVGACSEMILGREDENPRLGEGGTITPLSSPSSMANALAKLLLNPEYYQRCSQAIRARVERYYNKKDLEQSYRALYESMQALPDRGPGDSGAGLTDSVLEREPSRNR